MEVAKTCFRRRPGTPFLIFFINADKNTFRIQDKILTQDSCTFIIFITNAQF